MLEIILLKESVLKRLWAFLRFGVWYNHVGLVVDREKFLHLGYGGVKISRMPIDKRKFILVHSGISIGLAEASELCELIRHDYRFGDFDKLRIDRARLVFPFLPPGDRNRILCNEFIDDLYWSYTGEIVNTLALARRQ